METERHQPARSLSASSEPRRPQSVVWATYHERVSDRSNRCRATDERAKGAMEAIVAVIAAMVIVMAVIAFTLHRNSRCACQAPTVTTSEPSTSGQGGIAPERGRTGIER